MHNTHHHQIITPTVERPLSGEGHIIGLPSKNGASGRRARRFALLELRTSKVRPARAERSVAYPLMKITSVFLVATVLGLGLSATGGTISYFSDIEIAAGNRLVADPLGFTVALQDTPLPVDMSADAQVVIPFVTPNEDSEPIQYRVDARMTDGDETLCRGLYLASDAPFSYDGLLLAFSTGMATTTGAIPLTVTLPAYEPLPVNSSCTVDFVFEARNADALPGAGYSDIQHLLVQFFVPASSAPAAPLMLSIPEPEEGTSTSDLVESTSTPDIILNIEGEADTISETQGIEDVVATSTPAIEETTPTPLTPAEGLTESSDQAEMPLISNESESLSA